MKQMLKTVLLAVFLAGAITGIAADKKVFCYYGSWAAYRPGLGACEPSHINPALCTHMIYTFVGITTNGDVQVLDSWLDLPNGRDGFGKFTRLRQSSPGTKAMIAIGGWNEGSAKYSQVAANPQLRARFAQNVVNFLRTYNFDGFDVDWEYPNQRGGNPSDKLNFILLLKELKEAFNKHGYILSVAVGAAESLASKSYHIANVSQNVDFINLMTYDYHGSWDSVTGTNAPLYALSSEQGNQIMSNVNASVQYWLSEGASADKLILGVPSYGRSFTLANPGNNGVGAPASGPGNSGPYTQATGMLGYNEICEKLRQGWTVRREEQQRVPYAFSGNQWVGYDDPTSIAEKANYVLSNGLGGVMMWSIETDDFRGTCGDKYPLLSTINKILRGNVPNQSSPQT
ncbi:acidic mammalian chitinase-like [Ceratina calcarata]|uniref:Acidic mammalian chitinase-like n=1 Tax=Ceratina calcarata TaxID=156304 RepID=A0AAJ7NDU0_9HYME|nr:acidic mammalian chitinase-like [Ceratina calcarata]